MLECGRAGLLLILLGSNHRPALHLAEATTALDTLFPVEAELGRCRAPAVGGAGIYENRLLRCRTRSTEGGPDAIDARIAALERNLAPPRTDVRCPIDIDPFLLRRADGRVQRFARTAKVMALLGAIDATRLLGAPAWARPRRGRPGSL